MPPSACRYSAPTVIKLLSGLFYSSVWSRLCHLLPPHLCILVSCCVLFGTFSHRCSENVLERRNRDRGGGFEASMYTLAQAFPTPGLHATAWLLPPAVIRGRNIVNAKLPQIASPTRRQESISRGKIQPWQNGKISHARVSRSDDPISFNQPSLTHDRSRLPRYSRQLSFMRSAATIISAGYDYPLVGLTHQHGHLPLVSLIKERKTPICSMLHCLKPFSIPSLIYLSQDGEIWMVNA